MRVVQVLGGAEDGGLEKHTIELTRALKDRGVDISVIAHKKFRDDFKDIAFSELDLSKGRNNPLILYKLYAILKRESFDIIHTQANKATDMVIKLKPFLNSKIVSTLHNYKNNVKSFEKSDFVITVSDKIGENLKTKNKTTIYNGIAVKEIKKIDLYQEFNIPKSKFVLCSVGRFVDVKKFDILIESIKETDVHLILVGDGYNKEQLVKLSNSEQVTFTGYLEQKRTKEIVKSSHIFVMTSLREGFPYTFVESMFCQTPFISTPVSDIEKFITPKYIVPFDDTKELTKKIIYAKNNYNQVLQDFNPIFKLAKEKFSVENMTNSVVEIYKKVLI